MSDVHSSGRDPFATGCHRFPHRPAQARIEDKGALQAQSESQQFIDVAAAAGTAPARTAKPAPGSLKRAGSNPPTRLIRPINAPSEHSAVTACAWPLYRECAHLPQVTADTAKSN